MKWKVVLFFRCWRCGDSPPPPSQKKPNFIKSATNKSAPCACFLPWRGTHAGQVGAFAAPDTFHYTPTGLPKTRSGKIMRRVLRKVASLGKAVTPADLGDTSTLADPSVVDDLVASHAGGTKKSK